MSDAAGDPLLPPDWAALEPLVDQVLDAPPESRTALIAALAAGDAARGRELARLVEECERKLPLLDRPAAEQFGSLARDPAAPMLPEVVADRYRVGRELGHGGMACVYLAHDTKHGREVAIKVIRPELGFSLGHDRFLREIEIAARLRHPNIVPLYDSGEVGGVLFFVMPYEEGPSLRALLDQAGPLPVGDAVGVLRDVARALAYAHEHGVVHRDIKPDNVMLSGGAAVVTDFGIAKAVSAALGDAAHPTLTQTGSGIGTPAYMAPEQATGDPHTDHRADIYSLGCLAYEVFTGKPPFDGPSVHQIVAAHLTASPAPMSDVRAGIPSEVSALISRCLAKDPADRPQSAREVLAVLDGGASPVAIAPVALPARPATTGSRANPLRRAGLVAAAALTTAAAAIYLGRDPAAAVPLSVAVLPFGNINADSQLTFVADGLADEVAVALSRVPGIQIKSRNGARNYRGQLSPDVAEAGARLKADYIMTAVVRQDQDRWIVSADLERATDAASLWSENFTLKPDEHAGAAGMITASVVGALQAHFPRLVGPPPRMASNQRTSNNEAYRLWLRGQEKLNRRGQSVSESAELFRQAIRLDPNYAQAWSGLSMALALFPYFEQVKASEVHDSVMAAATRALSLDSSLAEPHVARGMVLQFAHRWDSAGADLETAVRLDPRNVEARVQYARYLLKRGRTRDALGQLRMARAEDPASALVLSWTAYAFFLLGDRDSALAESRRALENDPTNLPTLGLAARVRSGRNLPPEVRTFIVRGSLRFWDAARVMAESGDTAAARLRMREEDAQVPQPPFAESRRAFGHLGLGEANLALDALERAEANGEIWASFSPVSDPLFDPVRDNPRFRALLQRAGLADVLTNPAR